MRTRPGADESSPLKDARKRIVNMAARETTTARISTLSSESGLKVEPWLTDLALPGFDSDSIGRGLRVLGGNCATYPMVPAISNIGRYIATKTPPMMVPSTTMTMGSIMEVKVSTAASTSSS